MKTIIRVLVIVYGAGLEKNTQDNKTTYNNLVETPQFQYGGNNLHNR